MQHATPARAHSASIILSDPSAFLAEKISVAFLAQYKATTREAYTIDLTLWGRWLAEHDIDPITDVTRTTIELWVQAELARGLATATVARRLGTVKGWYRFAFQEEFIDADPGARVKPIKVHERHDLPYLDRWDMARIVEAALEHPRRNEATALVFILGFNGLRISEVTQLDVENYSRIGGFHTLHFVRKGGKLDSVPLSPEPIQAIEACIGDRRSGPILRNCEGRRMTRRNAHDLIDQLVAVSGVQKHVTPHTFRRSVASIGLDAGVSITDMALTLGHSSVLTTMRYDRRRNELARNAQGVIAQQVAAARRL